MNVLEFYDAAEPDETAGFRRILVTEATTPTSRAWWPPGHGLGYEHGFTHQVVDLVNAIADGTDPTPTFADGLQVQRVLAAVETSSDTRTWQEIPDMSATTPPRPTTSSPSASGPSAGRASTSSARPAGRCSTRSRRRTSSPSWARRR